MLLRAREKAGFTLVEMLMVLFIVSILLGIVLGSARYAMQMARISRAESDLHTLADALDRFHLVFGEYPPARSATNLVAYSRPALGGETRGGDRDTFLFANLLPSGFTAIDPWSNPYAYRVFRPDEPTADVAPEDETTYTLSSWGPDGKEGTDDDIAAP